MISTVTLLRALADGPMRSDSLLRRFDGIDLGLLVLTLRSLEGRGLVERRMERVYGLDRGRTRAALAAQLTLSSVRVEVRGVPDIHSLHVDAGPGETNTATITHVEDGWTVTDVGAPLSAGDRCTSVDEHTVRCEITSEVWVRGGDGDDALTIVEAEQIASHLDGGPGDDALTGGDGRDLLEGGGGTDMLRGGGGSDLLDDSDGVAPDADRFDGGPGFDEVNYRDRRTAIRADLRHAFGHGALGENDAFASIEGVAGGRGDDRWSARRAATTSKEVAGTTC